jgi:hypothetical protein
MVSTEAGIEGDQRVCRWQVACDELGALARTRGNEPRGSAGPRLGLARGQELFLSVDGGNHPVGLFEACRF